MNLWSTSKYDIFINPYYFRVIENKENQNSKIFCLIHGWSGNESSMSIFLPAFQDYKFLVFPRGPIKIGENEYAWIDVREKIQPNFEDYSLTAKIFQNSYQEIVRSLLGSGEVGKNNFIGFSQGAAVCAVMSIIFPELFNKIALISGFLPPNPPTLIPGSLSNNHYYIAHGIRDNMVSFEKAIKLKNYLSESGATVDFCQEDLGHKIGKNCLKNLKNFFLT